MQANAGKLAFAYSQAVSQALSSSASQTATESVSQTVSCLQNAGPNTFTREGTRDGGRSGNRAGSRTGTQSGSVSSAIDYASRTHNQVDGFFLTAVGAGAFVASGTPIWGDATFGEWTWGTVNWGAWSPGDVHVCLGGNPNVTDLVDSGVVDGTTQYGAVDTARPSMALLRLPARPRCTSTAWRSAKSAHPANVGERLRPLPYFVVRAGLVENGNGGAMAPPLIHD